MLQSKKLQRSNKRIRIDYKHRYLASVKRRRAKIISNISVYK